MSIDVTVIIPVHNTGRGVLAGLESLRAQTLPRSRFEVIYVDDGSTDGTGELLDTELAGEENFSVVHIENSGWPGRPATSASTAPEASTSSSWTMTTTSARKP